MSDEVLVNAELVSKKFCRSLKRSLWYGVTDVTTSMIPWTRGPHFNGSGPHAESAATKPLRHDEFWALQDVSFALRRGDCLGLIGHNGAGKSTLLKILNGLIPPDTGRITMRGRVAALIELNAGFNPILSGRENIFNQAALLGFSREETLRRFDAIVDFAEIGDFLDMPVQNYSSGMRVRLGFSVAAQMEPDILLIDEVLAVGDVAFRFKCLNAISDLMRSAAVIFVSHSMPQVFRICSEVAVLDHGVVTFQGADIATGVAAYLSLFKGGASTVVGSGEVQLRSLALETDTHAAGMSETIRLPFGSQLRLRAIVSASPGVQSARLQFVFWNAEMLPVMDVMSDGLRGHPFDVSGTGQVEISVSIPRVELNAGKYSVSVHATSDDQSRSYCRHDNAAYLQVEAATTSGACLLSVGEWVVRPAG